MYSVRLQNVARISLIGLLLSISLGRCNENFHAKYPDATALQKAGSGARSWFPAPLPASATDLEEWHNIDTNATVGRFRLDPRELPKFRQALSSYRSREGVASANLPMANVPDWPACLRGEVDASDISKCGFEAHRIEGFQMVIDPKGIAYFWTADDRP